MKTKVLEVGDCVILKKKEYDKSNKRSKRFFTLIGYGLLILFITTGFQILIFHFDKTQIKELKYERHNLYVSLIQTQKLLDSLVHSLPKVFISNTITATIYNATIEQCDSTPDILADGTKIHISYSSHYKYIAISRDLYKKWGGDLEFGDFVMIEGIGEQYDGIWIVKDLMNERFQNRIDFLVDKGVSNINIKGVSLYKIIGTP